MSPVRHLRDFVTQRLTAAAVEIFSVFEQTIARYEEELDRQRRIPEITWKPGVKSTRAGIPQQHVCDQETSSGLQIKEEQEEAEPPQVKEEPEDVCSAQPVVKLEPDTLMVTVTGGESDHSEAEADDQQLPSHSSVRRFINRQLTAAAVEIFSVVEQTVERYEETDRSRRREVDWKPTGTGSPPPHFYREKLLCDVETSSEPDQEEIQSLQIKEEDACTSREGESFVLETDDFLETPPDELSESDQVDEQLMSFGCAAASSRYVDSASNQNLELMSNEELPFFSLSAAMTSTNPGQSCATCDICGAAFKLISQLQRHRAVHAGEKPQSCPVCGKIFLQSRSLKNHIRNHTGEKPYSCAECGKKFGQKGHLKSHMNIHTGEKPFFCEACGKRFCQKSNLISHSRIHTGEKPYSCEICGRSFTGRGNLLVHLRTHTGEKPYPCEVCGKCFSRQDALSAHMRTHTGHKSHSLKPESEISESSDMS